MNFILLLKRVSIRSIWDLGSWFLHFSVFCICCIETPPQKLCTFNSNFDQFANKRDILVKMFGINDGISVTKSHYYKVP